MRPLIAVRKYCLWCMNESSKEIKLCPVIDCPLYLFRFSKRVKGKSVLKAIRKKCIDCGEGTVFAVRKCRFFDCPLYQYRFGHNPRLKGKRKGNPEGLRQYNLKRHLSQK